MPCISALYNAATSSNRRKVLAVTTQLKQLRKESLKSRLSFRNCLSCVVTARILLLFDISSAVQIYVSYIYIRGWLGSGSDVPPSKGRLKRLASHLQGNGSSGAGLDLPDTSRNGLSFPTVPVATPTRGPPCFRRECYRCDRVPGGISGRWVDWAHISPGGQPV